DALHRCEQPDRMDDGPALVRLQGPRAVGGEPPGGPAAARGRPAPDPRAGRGALPDGHARALPAHPRRPAGREGAGGGRADRRGGGLGALRRGGGPPHRRAPGPRGRGRGRARAADVPPHAGLHPDRHGPVAADGRRAVQLEHRPGRAPGHEGLPPPGGGGQPRARDAALPHGRGLRAHRPPRRLVRLHGRAHGRDARRHAGLHPGRPRRLGDRAGRDRRGRRRRHRVARRARAGHRPDA
ncbi:MAG: hypothetical protein AVDCRST_MAG13-1988, partial [uncultured Solirubrobacteraceae bacterium]